MHLVPKVVPLARALADAGEHRITLMLGRDIADKFQNENGFADPGAAKEPHLTASRIGY